MESILIALRANWVVVACIIAVLLLAYFVRTYKKVRVAVYTLVLWAEKNILGSQRGQEKKAWVVDRLYAVLPIWVKPFINRAVLGKLVDEGVLWLKDYLDDGAINHSITAEVVRAYESVE